MKFLKDLRTGLTIGLGIMLSLGLTALFAQSLNEFAGGDLISASKINANFANLKSRMDTLTNRVDNPIPYQETAPITYNHTAPTNTWVDVPGMSLSVTTSGSPVWLGLKNGSLGMTDGTGNQSHMVVQFVRDGGSIGCQYNYALNASGSAGSAAIPASSAWCIDYPGAGTFTYKVQISLGAWGPGDQAMIAGARLVAARFNEL